MKTLPLTVLLSLLTAACGGLAVPKPQPTVLPPTTAPPVAPTAFQPEAEPVAATPTALPAPTELPTQAAFELPKFATATPFYASSFADFPGNRASNEAAPDFSAALLGGEQFTLSEWQEGYLLLVPTVVGCGDCMISMFEISKAYEDYPVEGLEVLFLDLYPEDIPFIWQEYADYFAHLNFLWGVVDSTDFVIDYGIDTLGAFVLIDPQGKIVFRSDHPLPEPRIKVLFDLATQANQMTEDGIAQ